MNTLTPEVATDEPASSFDTRSDGTRPPLLSDSLDDTLDDTFPPGTRKPRHDGWTPQAVAGFLHDLAAHGVVEHAARAVGLSAAAAYAFRNRRQGRAFAKMWDAVLVHRARARVASELQARAVAGCVSVRKKDGVVVGEYHYYDNRLAMALLTRLDRLAEREAPADAQLRTLAEDLDDYLDCLAEGGDADAFVEARRPVEPEPGPAAPSLPPDDDPDLTRFAHVAGCHDYRDVHPFDIEVRDLDPRLTEDWTEDQWVRAWRSGFMTWLELKDMSPGPLSSPGAPLQFHVSRKARDAAAALPEQADVEEARVDDLDPATILDWTDDQLARGWKSGAVRRLPAGFWDDLWAEEDEDGDEE